MSVLRKTHHPESSAVGSFSFPRFASLGPDLDITYANGRTYRYRGVPRSTIEELIAVEEVGKSVGGFINQHIKGKFDYFEL